jgi:ABC-type sugar transport system permease subunit
MYFLKRNRIRKHSGGKKSKIVYGIIPILLLFLVLNFGPVLASFFISLTNMWQGNEFVGLSNYLNFIDDEVAQIAMINTFYYVLGTVPTNVLIAFTIALMIESISRGKSIYRSLYFLPVITSMVGAGIVWRWLYQPMFGLINQVLMFLHLPPQMWLKSTTFALPSVMAMAIWKNFGYNLVLFMAALQGVPFIYYEAAKIDGATFWQNLRYITIPFLKPATKLIVITTMIASFQVFTEIYVMTQDRSASGGGSTAGGPAHATTVMVLLIQKLGFAEFKIGYASALAFIMFLIVAGLSLILFNIIKIEED